MPSHSSNNTVITKRHLRQGAFHVLQIDQVEMPWIPEVSSTTHHFVFEGIKPPGSETAPVSDWHRVFLQLGGSLDVKGPIGRLVAHYLPHAGLTEAELLEYPHIGMVRIKIIFSRKYI